MKARPRPAAVRRAERSLDAARVLHRRYPTHENVVRLERAEARYVAAETAARKEGS